MARPGRSPAPRGLAPLLCLLAVLSLCATLANGLPVADPARAPHATHSSLVRRSHDAASHRLHRRTIGGYMKDLYLMSLTSNYYCTKYNRVVPVTPETGRARTMMLRKRFDLNILNTEGTERGACKNPTWILLDGWSDPIPITQAVAQYPELFDIPNPGPAASTAPTTAPNPAAAAGGTVMLYPGAGAVSPGAYGP